MALDDAPADGEADTGAGILLLAVQPPEYLENALLVLLGDADAVVPD
ncbi:MAG TPA: hypothetical protein VJ576_18780 [Rhodocyclaceae bacterium]|nr:hypothetical protein [Rhodocyclaceae bacterium]